LIGTTHLGFGQPQTWQGFIIWTRDRYWGEETKIGYACTSLVTFSKGRPNLPAYIFINKNIYLSLGVTTVLKSTGMGFSRCMSWISESNINIRIKRNPITEVAHSCAS